MPVVRVPNVGEMLASAESLLSVLDARPLFAFRQTLEQGRPVDLPREVPAASSLEYLWVRGDGDAVVSIIVTHVDAPVEDEGGTWCSSSAGRMPGASLLAATLAVAIASCTGAHHIYDEPGSLGLGRLFTVLQFQALLRRVAGRSLQLAEASLFRQR